MTPRESRLADLETRVALLESVVSQLPFFAAYLPKPEMSALHRGESDIAAARENYEQWLAT